MSSGLIISIKIWTISKGDIILKEAQSEVRSSNGELFINGRPASKDNQLRQVGNLEKIGGKSGEQAKTGSINPFKFLSYFSDKNTVVTRWESTLFKDGEDKVTVYYSIETPGNKIMRPGLKFKVEGSPSEKLDFISLMILLSPSMYASYGLNPDTAPIPFNNPGIISIPLSFLTIVVVSLLTQKRDKVLTGTR